VSTARRLPKAIPPILACAALALASAPAAASPRPVPNALRATINGSLNARQADLARPRCAKKTARSPRRARRAAHACRASSRRLRARKLARPRPSVPAPAIKSTSGARTPPRAGRSAAQAAAATIAEALSTPCQNTELTPESGNIALVREAVLCLINRKRAEASESPLLANAQLEQAAEGHCQELVAEDYFAHVSPNGETPVDRVRNTGYIPSPRDGYVIGENLAWGTYQLSTPQSIVAAWFASPEHLANILESQYRETGIGITPAVPASVGAGAPGATYAQEFGVIIP
jgi:uncharacterized protein YkwD